MKMSKGLMLFMACLGLVGVTGAVIASSSPSIMDNVVLAQTRSPNYSCNDIVFSETVDNPGSYADLADVSTIYTTSLSCSMTDWTNANYKAGSAIKIGGSKSGKYDGSVTLTTTTDVSRLLIYATEWSNDPGTATLYVNGESHDVETTSDGNYQFKMYDFNFGDTNKTKTFTITNGTGNTGKRRIVISKIVLRCW